MTATVSTVLGPVDADSLGVTLMHEHVFTLNAEIRDEYPWDEDAVVAQAIAELNDLKSKGIDTIVDLTVFGLGRNIRRIRRIAEEVELNIIPATGVYTFRDLPTYFRVNEERAPGFIEDFLVREIEEGIDDTGVRPAILKVATDTHGVTPDLEVLLRAVARVHRRTGVPISTHADAHGEQGLKQQRIFLEEGVDLSRVVIGHVGDVTDLAYAEKLIEAGSFVGLDRCGIGGPLGSGAISREERDQVIVELCQRGYSDRVVLGHDTHVRSDSIAREARESDPNRAAWRFTYLSEHGIPRVLEAGVPQSDVDTMLVANPLRIFSQNTPY